MHPHVMALPFGLLAIGLALHTAARPLLPEFGRTRTGWSELVLAGIVLGSLYVINSWDFPTYLLLFLGALLLLHVRKSERGWSLGRRGWLAYGAQALGLAGCSIVLFLPFFLTFKSLVGGREPLVDIPVLGAITRTLGIVSWSHTPLQTFLIIFGLFFIPLLAFVRLAVRQPVHATQPAAGWSAHAILGSVALGGLAVGLLLGFPLLALLPIGLLAALGALQLARAGRVGEAFALWAFALGCMVCFGTEVIYLRDVFDNRMNTIFKFYYQLWLMWGTLAGYALWWLLVGAPQRMYARRPAVSAESREPDMQADGDDGHIARQANLVAYPWSAAAVLIVFVPLLAGALIYPCFTTGKALTEGTWVGLHGTTPRERSPDGAAAIAWLRATVPGDAVIVEAVSPLPTFGYDTEGLGLAGVSSSTGLATVMGWTSHQQQWRGGDPAAYAQIDTRRADVLSIYSSPDAVQARDLLHKYSVRYIYVGPTERALYPPEGIAKLSELGTVAFQQGDVTIIEVK
jgi:YYY domain-containing protein